MTPPPTTAPTGSPTAPPPPPEQWFYERMWIYTCFPITQSEAEGALDATLRNLTFMKGADKLTGSCKVSDIVSGQCTAGSCVKGLITEKCAAVHIIGSGPVLRTECNKDTLDNSCDTRANPSCKTRSSLDPYNFCPAGGKGSLDDKAIKAAMDSGGAVPCHCYDKAYMFDVLARGASNMIEIKNMVYSPINGIQLDMNLATGNKCPPYTPPVNKTEFKKVVVNRIEQREQRINKTAKVLEDLHVNKCTHVAGCKCTQMSCGAPTSGYTCVTGTYGAPKECATCGKGGAGSGASENGQGRLVDMQASTLQLSSTLNASNKQLKEQICYSKKLDAYWAQYWAEEKRLNPSDDYTLFEFYAGTAGAKRTFPGISREVPSYSGANPGSRCVNKPLLGTLGTLLYNKTCQECVAAGYTCAQCGKKGFDCSCACVASTGLPRDTTNNAKYCSFADPRQTPWYVAASTGPKDVVIVVDKSLSMTSPPDGIVDATLGLTRLDVMKVAIKSVLSTLNEADFVNVGAFSKKGDYLLTSFEHCRNQKAFGTPGCEWADPNDPSKQISIMYQLLKASPYNVSKLSSYVDSINADGSTFFNAGLDVAFDIFDKAKDGTGCKGQKIILFMTDGTSEDPEGVLKFIHARNQVHQAKIFTYTMGPLKDPLHPADWLGPNSNATGRAVRAYETEENAYSMNGDTSKYVDPRLPQAMACQTGASWTHIAEPLEAADSMLSFYRFMSLNVESTEARWTAPFVDEITGKNVTAAIFPSYDRSSGYPTMVGLTGQVIDMEYFGGASSEVALDELLTRAKKCPTGTANWCEMEKIRKELSHYTCAGMDASPPIYNSLNIPKGSSWKDAKTQRGPNVKEAGLFFWLQSNSNLNKGYQTGDSYTSFGFGGSESTDGQSKVAGYQQAVGAFTIDFKKQYVDEKSSLKCSADPAAGLCKSLDVPASTAICSASPPTCAEKSSCCGSWSCASGPSKCYSPCTPSPCGTHGSCSVSSVGLEVCTCSNGWRGAKCTLAPGCGGIAVNKTTNPAGTMGTCYLDGTLAAGKTCQLGCAPGYALEHAPGGQGLSSTPGEVICSLNSAKTTSQVKYYHACAKQDCTGIVAPEHGSLGSCTGGGAKNNVGCKVECDPDFTFKGTQPLCSNGQLTYSATCVYDTTKATQPTIVQKTEYKVTVEPQEMVPAVEGLSGVVIALLVLGAVLVAAGMALFYVHHQTVCVRELTITVKGNGSKQMLMRGNLTMGLFKDKVFKEFDVPQKRQVISWAGGMTFQDDESVVQSVHSVGLRDNMTVNVEEGDAAKRLKASSIPHDAAFEDARLKKLAKNVSDRGHRSPRAQAAHKEHVTGGADKVTPDSFLDEFKGSKAAP